MNHCAARTKEVLRLLHNNIVPIEHAEHWSMSCARQATCVHDVETGRYLICRQHRRYIHDVMHALDRLGEDANDRKLAYLRVKLRGLDERQLQVIIHHLLPASPQQ